MGRNVFKFKHGDILTTMGAAWFVSRAYYEYINKSHINWKRVSTFKNRNSVFMNRAKDYHLYFLEKVEHMNIKNLNKNTIHLEGEEIKKMAIEIRNRVTVSPLQTSSSDIQ